MYIPDFSSFASNPKIDFETVPVIYRFLLNFTLHTSDIILTPHITNFFNREELQQYQRHFSMFHPRKKIRFLLSLKSTDRQEPREEEGFPAW
jgi:hypothetical protein